MNALEFEIATRSEASVLILGATGTGKSTLAREIHAKSSRAGGPFVVVNLASVYEGTLEGELFGHERGAFTGADSKRVGRLEAADGGTVFLDEIGELSLRTQARLLEFLQSRTVVPLGSNQSRKVDVRVIAATHRDLKAMVKAGEFREDLFHRIRVICLKMPSLLERRDEFDEIVHQVIAELAGKTGKQLHRIEKAVASLFESHLWPGNIRELRNVLEYAVEASQGPEIRVGDLPRWFFESLEGDRAEGLPKVSEGWFKVGAHLSFADAYREFEQAYFQKLLSRCDGRLRWASWASGLHAAQISRRVRALGWSPRQFTRAEYRPDCEVGAILRVHRRINVRGDDRKLRGGDLDPSPVS